MRITSAPAVAAPRSSDGPSRNAVRLSPAAGALAQDATTLGRAALFLVLAGVGYNTLLAFLSARGVPLNTAIVGATEFLILGACGLAVLRTGLRRTDAPAILLIIFFLVVALIVSLVNGAPFPEMARNAAVIGLFLLVGDRVEERFVHRAVATLAGLVFVILLLESVSVTSYAWLLEPGLYFEQTRGISRFELDEIGLFANALGFDDRFSILNIVGHRTSSIFLEQVSLANFATVLTVFLASFWPRLPTAVRIAYPLLIAFILVTNNSRTALAIALAAPLVYLLAPKLPRLATLALMPVTLLAALTVALVAPPSKEDDLVGRLGLTIRTLRELDLAAVLGARAGDANDFLDSGYTFVIYSSTILGMVVLWFFFSVIVAGAGAAQKRASWMIGLYLFLNLTVSGTSVFSIKTAALLWFLVGFLRAEELRSSNAANRTAALAGLQRRT